MDSDFFEKLCDCHWQLQPAVIKSNCVMPIYLAASHELKEFMSSYDELINAQESVWFISAKNINDNQKSGFSWNEFQLMSLDASQGDDEWANEIKDFWKAHLPVLMSVKAGYAYVAYCICGDNQGKFVHGCEPEFEEVTVIANSLTEFKSWILCTKNEFL